MQRALKLAVAAAEQRRSTRAAPSAVTGSMTLSSRKLPVWPKAIVASLPTTRATTIVRLSTMTGFTLPGMMLEPGCVSGSASSASPARGPIPISRTSEAIFHRLRAIVRIAPWAAIGDVERRLGVEVVGGLADGQPGQRRQPGAGPEGVLGMGVDPGPDGGPAERHGEQLGLGGAGAAERFLDLPGVAAELLAEPDRRRVLEVGPAGLDDRPELLLLGDERGVEPLEGGQQVVLDGHRGRQLERGRDRVVRALAAVDVVVRVDLPAAEPGARRGGRRPRSCSCWSRCRSRSGRRRSGTGRRARRRRPRAPRPAIAAATSASSRPSSPFVSAAASLTSASARRKRRGSRGPEIGKLRTARWVEAPYRASAGTSISPIESRSMRVAGRASSVMARL